MKWNKKIKWNEIKIIWNEIKKQDEIKIQLIKDKMK